MLMKFNLSITDTKVKIYKRKYHPRLKISPPIFP